LIKTFSRKLEVTEVEWKLLKLKKTADKPCFVFFLIYDRENKNASAQKPQLK
jgi:hypothetical protein